MLIANLFLAKHDQAGGNRGQETALKHTTVVVNCPAPPTPSTTALLLLSGAESVCTYVWYQGAKYKQLCASRHLAPSQTHT